MTSIQEAAGIITRWGDPQGDSFGFPANVSYNFWGGRWAFTSNQQDAARGAMQLWSDVAQINFFFDSGANADVEIEYRNMLLEPNELGKTTNTGPGQFNPNDTHRLGINVAYTGTWGNPITQLGQGQVGLFTLIHELGHAIGFDGDSKVAYPEDSWQYSVMSYNSETTTGANFNGQWARTPLLHDIAAAQHFYGANMKTRTDNDVYGFHSNAGAAYTLSSPNEQAVFTIWDAWGNDTLDLSGYNVTQTINLNPNTFSNTGGLTANMSMADAVDVNGNNSWEAGFDPNRIANYIENAIGGSERDIIYGNATGNTLRGENGNDLLWGDDGWDRLFGGAGVDDLHGGEGKDTLWGDSEDDTLVGDGGDDAMFGGTGNDKYVVTDRGDTVTEEAGDANGTADKVFTTLDTYDLRDGNKVVWVEELQFVGEGSFTGHGNELHNWVVGGAGWDTLEGHDGNDHLVGGGGNDTLRGGNDSDTAVFEGSRAEYDISGSPYFYFTITDSVAGRDGTDTVFGVEFLQFADGIFAVSDFIEIARIVGTESGEVMVGDERLNHFMALGGNDEVIPLAGPDIVDGGADVDTVNYATSPTAVTVNFATGTGLGGDAEGDTFISIEHAIGSAFDDSYQGGNYHARFLAGDGHDTMIGGSVFDWLEGGNGNDTFIGTGGQTAMFGDDGDDTMTGSLTSSNYMYGGLGRDIMTGGEELDYVFDQTGGDDVMHAGGGGDVMIDLYGVAEMYGEGDNDTMQAALGTGVLDGGTGDDYLYVSNGNYTLVGGADNDTLEFASVGSATFTGGTGADIFTYRVLVGGGDYTVTDFEDGVDHIHLWDNHYYGTVPFESLTIADSEAGAVISWLGTSHMVLSGIQASQLTQDDFLL